MAKIRSFRAIHPPVDKAAKVSSVPYDVVYDSEVREIVANNPANFLRVTKPEALFPAGATVDEIRAAARAEYEKMFDEGLLVKDDADGIFVYRLTMNGRSQTGIVACCSVDEYDNDLIKKHEKTRPDKVEDRTKHILAVGAQTGLIFLAYRNTDEIRDLIAKTVEAEPMFDMTTETGIRHTIWRTAKPDAFVSAFADVPELYIADGHHRAESASLTRKKRQDANPGHTGNEEYNFVMAGIFPSEDLSIMAYNRWVEDLNGLSKDEFIAEVEKVFVVSKNGEKEPQTRGFFSMYLDGEWYTLKYAVDHLIDPGPIESLDVSILQKNLLEPVLGIDDPRTNDRIKFVGGARGTAELEKMVNEKPGSVAFSLYPTTMDDLFAVADINEIMPPKSTWFEPKLRDGFLVHEI